MTCPHNQNRLAQTHYISTIVSFCHRIIQLEFYSTNQIKISLLCIFQAYRSVQKFVEGAFCSGSPIRIVLIMSNETTAQQNFVPHIYLQRSSLIASASYQTVQQTAVEFGQNRGPLVFNRSALASTTYHRIFDRRHPSHPGYIRQKSGDPHRCGFGHVDTRSTNSIGMLRCAPATT